MSDYKYLGRNFKTFTPVKPFAPYSRVVINIDDDTAVSAGNDSGYTLQIECPWGTQAMAENILRSLSDKAYQPYKASDAQLDPAVELGDALSIGGVYGVLYQQRTKLTAGAVSQIGAPGEQEVNHEYPYKSPTTRKFTRQTKALRADITLISGQISLEVANRIDAVSELTTRMDLTDREISAKVSQTGGSNASFGWSMDVSRHAWYADGSLVMDIKRSGLKVEGEIIAKSGKIGDCTISNGKLTVPAANISGKLTASQIDATSLKVSAANITGKLTAEQIDATSLKVSAANITGTLDADTINVTNLNAANITQGTLPSARIGEASILGTQIASGTVTGGNIGSYTITAGNTNSYINTGIANGYDAADAFAGGHVVDYLYVTRLGNVRYLNMLDSVSVSKGNLYLHSALSGNLPATAQILYWS